MSGRQRPLDFTDPELCRILKLDVEVETFNAEVRSCADDLLAGRVVDRIAEIEVMLEAVERVRSRWGPARYSRMVNKANRERDRELSRRRNRGLKAARSGVDIYAEFDAEQTRRGEVTDGN